MAAALMHRVTQRLGTQVVAADADFAQMVIIPVPVSVSHCGGDGGGDGDPDADPDSLRRRLFEDHKIEVPSTTHAGQSFVRVSVQGYNTAADLQRLENALVQLAR